MTQRQSLDEITDEELDETFRTNIYGYFYMARAALKHLKPGAAIINTGSVAGMEGPGELPDYSATKGAIHAFTKSLAQMLVEQSIRVNCVAPGPVWTPLNASARDEQDMAEYGGKVPDGPPRPARGDRPGLRLLRLRGRLQLHHRRGPLALRRQDPGRLSRSAHRASRAVAGRTFSPQRPLTLHTTSQRPRSGSGVA